MKKKLTKEEAKELNKLFDTDKFKPEMSGLNLYTTLTQINSKTIRPGKNNLRAITITNSKRAVKMVGRFLGKSRELLHVTTYSGNGEVLKEFDFNCSTLYSKMSNKDKQFNDLNEKGEIEFRQLVGDIFVPKSWYIGFKVLYN